MSIISYRLPSRLSTIALVKIQLEAKKMSITCTIDKSSDRPEIVGNTMVLFKPHINPDLTLELGIKIGMIIREDLQE